MKTFNTTGKCIPSKHYMVDISYQVEAAVFSLSFEGLGDSAFESDESLLFASLELMEACVCWDEVPNLSDSSKTILKNVIDNETRRIGSIAFSKAVSLMSKNDRIVLLIDEVDAAGNHIEFIKFLGLLCEIFLKRDVRPTFQSVILAGVYDIKNLKLKLRPEDHHQYNSPWNIAVPFDTNMSLPAEGIAGMLTEYKTDHHLEFDEHFIGQMIYDYTSGYPFLVSRLCQIIDEENFSWNREGVLKAVNKLLKENNTLFDDIEKKVSQFPTLSDMLKAIIFGGKRVAFNYYDRDINIASMFNFVKEKQGTTVIFCRIFETWLYNLFISNAKETPIYQQGEYDKGQFSMQMIERGFS